jgi:hypothetical protein
MWVSSTAIRELTSELTRIAAISLDKDTANARAIVAAVKELGGDGNSCCNIVEAINQSAQSRDARLELLIASVDNINKTLKRRFFKPPNPKPLKLVITEEFPSTGDTQMVDMLAFKVQLPTPPIEPNDIVNGQLTVQIGDNEPEVIITTKDQLEVEGLVGEQDSTVNMTFVYIDDSGNTSEEPSTLIGTLTDTFPPPKPGVLGLVVTGETHPAPPVPSPSEPVEEPSPSEPTPEEPEEPTPSEPIA